MLFIAEQNRTEPQVPCAKCMQRHVDHSSTASEMMRIAGKCSMLSSRQENRAITGNPTADLHFLEGRLAAEQARHAADEALVVIPSLFGRLGPRAQQRQRQGRRAGGSGLRKVSATDAASNMHGCALLSM